MKMKEFIDWIKYKKDKLSKELNECWSADYDKLNYLYGCVETLGEIEVMLGIK